MRTRTRAPRDFPGGEAPRPISAGSSVVPSRTIDVRNRVVRPSPGQPVTHQGSGYRAWERWAVGAVLLAWTLSHLFPPINLDVGYLLYAAKRWLSGDRLYVDVIDINTP